MEWIFKHDKGADIPEEVASCLVCPVCLSFLEKAVLPLFRIWFTFLSMETIIISLSLIFSWFLQRQKIYANSLLAHLFYLLVCEACRALFPEWLHLGCVANLGLEKSTSIKSSSRGWSDDEDDDYENYQSRTHPVWLSGGADLDRLAHHVCLALLLQPAVKILIR